MKATARANTNVPLIKCWGNRDEVIFTNKNSSISITLDQFYTTTTVQFCKCLSADIYIYNNHLAEEFETLKISRFLDRMRKTAGESLFALVTSTSNIPSQTGLSISAPLYASLAAAATKALDLDIDRRNLSILAQKGSQSAGQSVYGGFVEWTKGRRADGDDSYANPILTEQDWNLSIISVTIKTRGKKTARLEKLKQLVRTSPPSSGWRDTAVRDFELAKEAIKKRDLSILGTVIEANSIKMHTSMLETSPLLMYWKSGTMDVISSIHRLRALGIPVFFMISPKQNIKVLCLPRYEQIVRMKPLTIETVEDVVICHPGSGTSYLSPRNKGNLYGYLN